MKDLNVRDIEDEILVRIDSLAKKHNMSRSEYIRILLKNKTIEEDIIAVQERYETLVKNVLDILEIHTQKINALLEYLEQE